MITYSSNGSSCLSITKIFLLGFAFIFLYQVKVHGQLFINEVSASNSTLIRDSDFNNYSDWIELYNAGSTSVKLDGYYLSDNLKSPLKWQFPPNSSIAANGHLLIWADGKNTALHTSYKLSASGEEIGLFSPAGNLLDSIVFTVQEADISYGRIDNGNSNWGFFQRPTPGTANTSESFEDFLGNEPEFSVRGGFYSSSVNIKLSSVLGGIIRYTTDGSVPDDNSLQATENIVINKSSALRARIFKEGLIPGPTITQSYFINENSVDEKLPVVSIATAPENFWDAQKGIYVQDIKPEWDIPVNIELFENNGSDRAAFNERAGIKVNGLWSWQLPQKMLGVYFKKQYGSSKLEYPLLHQRPRNSYKSFALRASGSDWSYTLFRDMLGQNATLYNMDVDIMGFRPSVVFVNGEYMGIHNIREKVDDDYIEKSYQLDPGSFDLIENEDFAEAGDLDAYLYFLTLLEKDLSIEANYQAVTEVMDIESFTDYVITEIITANTSISHNVMAWKPKTYGKWRWVLMDLDRGFFNPSDHLIDYYTSQEELPLNELLKNNEYREYFASRLSAHLFTGFHPTRMKQLIDEQAQMIEAEIPRHIERWKGRTSSYGDAMSSVSYWNDEVAVLKTFVEERPIVLLNDLMDYGFSGAANLSIAIYPSEAGTININELTIPEATSSGSFPKGLSIQLKASNKPGYQFIAWTSSDIEMIISKNSNWKYHDQGADLDSSWTDLAYNDNNWKKGNAPLGYSNNVNTVISYGNDSENKFITSYFRNTFTISDELKNANQFVLNLMRDDGAVVYLNGQEIILSNMRSGTINYLTKASSTIGGSSESEFNSYTISPDLFVSGENILSVEIHQASISSSDLSFDLELKCVRPNTGEFISSNSDYALTLSDDVSLTAVFEQVSNCILPAVISKNLTLSSACSPYLAQGDVSIDSNASLFIEEGVEIWMPEDASMHVNGRVIAIGTANQPIVFKANQDSPSGKWGGISFQNTSLESKLNHVTIEDATRGTHPVLENAAISAFHANLTLDHIVVENVFGNPVMARYSEITMTNSRLHSTITGDLINVKYGKAFIANCSFVGNDQPDTDAIDYDEIENGVIRNCVITDFYGFNSDAIDLGEKASHILVDSVFVHNTTDKGVSVGQGSTAIVQNSVFVNCSKGVAVKDSSSVQVKNCVFYGNEIGVHSAEKNKGHAGGNVVVVNSIISNVYQSDFYVDALSNIDIEYCLSDQIKMQNNTTNLVGNPHFKRPSYIDFELGIASPARESGMVDGSPFDMGVFYTTNVVEPDVMFFQIFINPLNTFTPEFITLYNPSNQRIDLSNYSFSKGINCVIPEGTTLASNAYLYLTSDLSSEFWPRKSNQLIQWGSGKLSNSGETIQLVNSYGIVIDQLKYTSDGKWPIELFNENQLIELIDPELDNHFPENWKAKVLIPDEFLDSSEASTSFTIYPNPAKEIITICDINSSYEWIEIYKPTGELIERIRNGKTGLQTLNLTSYTSGLLIIRIGQQAKKVIILK